MNDMPTYPSGNASLFAVMTRTMGDVTIICPYCLSEDIIEIDHEYGVEYCNDCESRFERPSSDTSAGVDRDGQGGPPAGR